MELTEFADVVDRMIIEHDYPGFEPRSLRLGLPQAALKSSQRMFGSALGHENIFVKLAALRWFQEKPGIAKTYTRDIVALLDHQDAWVRLEAMETLSRIAAPAPETAAKVARLLKDENPEVRKTAAKAIRKMVSKQHGKNEEILASLQEAARDADPGVRGKALKALRQIGEFEG
ncbi:MAG TPA: HEAT repeat domain-containing protein [Chroococcales cyanobacterium]